MKNPMQKYVKGTSSENATTVRTSINIEAKQHEFLLVNNLNLSAMVRDMLSEAMASEKPGKRKTA